MSNESPLNCPCLLVAQVETVQLNQCNRTDTIVHKIVLYVLVPHHVGFAWPGYAASLHTASFLILALSIVGLKLELNKCLAFSVKRIEVYL